MWADATAVQKYIVSIVLIVAIIGVISLVMKTSEENISGFATRPPRSTVCGDGICSRYEATRESCPADCPATDSDGDGLYDYQEQYGLLGALTDPNDSDSDNDGLTDGEELLIYGTNPNNADMDGDGLSDYDEVMTYGSNPNNPDTDGDGHPDPVEVSFGTDPTDATSSPAMDTDSDGLSDVSEGRLGTDRSDADSDDDGISDGEEVNTYGTDPTDADSDDDGFGDYDEITKGTDALDATVFPEEPSEMTMDLTGPYYHEVFVATSSDGETWNVGSDSIVQHASVPDLIVLDQEVGDFAAGTLLTYFVDARNLISEGIEEIGVMYSTDNGITWSEQEVISFIGSEGQIPVDPSIVQLENGSLRLYYFDINTSRSGSGEFVMDAAYSEDGRTFTVEQAAFTSTTLMTDPEVIFFNEMWMMYMPLHDADGNNIALISTNGLDFEYVQDINRPGHPQGAVVVGDEVYLYGCGEGITLATASDGLTFTTEQTVIEGMYCDTGPVLLSDGNFVMVIKGALSE